MFKYHLAQKLRFVFAVSLLSLLSPIAFAGLKEKPIPDNSKPAVVIVPAHAYTTKILDQMNQSFSLPKAHADWFGHIGISGGLNLDTLKAGERTTTGNCYGGGVCALGYQGENAATRYFSINNAYLNISTQVNRYLSVFNSLSYTDAAFNYSAAYLNLPDSAFAGNNNARLNMEQTFMRLSYFECLPFFIELGKEFQDFSRYPLHPITESFTQVLSETLRNSVKLGFVHHLGFNGSVSLFQNPTSKLALNIQENSLNYIAALGFSRPDDQHGYELGIAYIYNLFGVNNIGNIIPAFYHKRVGGIAAYADLNTGPFTFNLRYTGSVQTFSPLDFTQNLLEPATGAKPWAMGIEAGYNFISGNKTQNIYVGYQKSRGTVSFNLPKARLLAGYGIDVLKNVAIISEWDHDIAYSQNEGGARSGTSNLFNLRLAAEFTQSSHARD